MSEEFSIAGKTVLITGATSGIGLECAKNFSSEGANIVALGRSAERLESLRNQIGEKSNVFVAADLSSPDFAAKLSDFVPEVDAMFYCAGVDMRMPIKFSDREAERRLFQINYFSAVDLTRFLIKSRKIKKGGSILYMSSVSADFANAGHFAYGNSKAALCAFAREMAVELAPRKIRANCLSAGLVETPMTSEFVNSDSDELAADRKKYLLGYGCVKDISNAVRFFVSDASRWITGSNLIIDGGYSCWK